MIPSLQLTVLPSQCCGIAGTYGFKKENYATSQGIGAPLFEAIEKAGVEYVVTDCETSSGRSRCPPRARSCIRSACWRGCSIWNARRN